MSTIGSLLSSFWEKIREGFTFLIQSVVDGLQWLVYIAPIERSAKLRESSERRDYGHEKTMDRQGKARDSA